MKDVTTPIAWRLNISNNSFNYYDFKVHDIFNGFFNASFEMVDGDKTIRFGETNTKYRQNNNEPYRFTKQRWGF